MKLGSRQQRFMDFLVKHDNRPHYVRYRSCEDKRLVNSLEKRGLIGVFRYPPNASRDCLVTLTQKQP